MAADISPFIKDAQRLQQETGIPASITLGQIILESSGKNAGGLSGLAYYAKNLFGVKGSGNAGSHLVPTTEYVNGKPVVVQAAFRKYNTFYDSMLDHARVLSLPRYQTHLSGAKTVNDYAHGIKAGGYATDPQYAQKLLKIIGNYNLNQYDGGNMKYTPVSGSSGGTSNKGTTTTTTPTTDNKQGMVESIFFNVNRVVIILGLFILLVIFFLKAFPAVEDTASNVATVAPPVRIAKIAKAAKGIKAVKAAT